jgi:phenylalanyl-tRNA synthetase beta subunit
VDARLDWDIYCVHDEGSEERRPSHCGRHSECNIGGSRIVGVIWQLAVLVLREWMLAVNVDAAQTGRIFVR